MAVSLIQRHECNVQVRVSMAWWAWAQVGGGNDGVFAGVFKGIDEQGCCLILIRLKVMDRKNGGFIKASPSMRARE